MQKQELFLMEVPRLLSLGIWEETTFVFRNKEVSARNWNHFIM